MSPLTPETIALANNPINKLVTHGVLDLLEQSDVMDVIRRHSGTESSSDGCLNTLKMAKYDRSETHPS